MVEMPDPLPRSQRPVVGLDIDGTLGDYHPHFLRFAAQWLGVRGWPGPKENREVLLGEGRDRAYGDDEFFGTCTLAEFMGVSKQTYRKIKLSYRMGGLKRSMPLLPGAKELVRSVRASGCELWLCTTRPYLSHDNIDSDTREWCRRNGIRPNGILWGSHKWRELARTVGKERILFALDDEKPMVDQAIAVGLPAWLAVRPYNLSDVGDRVYPLFGVHRPDNGFFKSLVNGWRQGRV